MSSYNIKKVAVLGTGVMGSQIAAHLSNAKIEVYAYDINQETATNGLESCKRLTPSPFYNYKTSDLITPMNYDDHLEKLKECDWIIEAISERLDWKQDLYNKIIPFTKGTTVGIQNAIEYMGVGLTTKNIIIPTVIFLLFFILFFRIHSNFPHK